MICALRSQPASATIPPPFETPVANTGPTHNRRCSSEINEWRKATSFGSPVAAVLFQYVPAELGYATTNR